MNTNNTKKEQGIGTQYSNVIKEGKEAECNFKKPKIEACSVQGEVVVETSNDKLAVVKEDNEAHGWDNVIE